MNGLLWRVDASCVVRSGLQLRMLLRIGELGWRDPRVFVVCAGGMLLVLRGCVDTGFVLGAQRHRILRYWEGIGSQGPLYLDIQWF